jgi:antibiotic biosynthesis monooxygenase (ABM) superfamily enzyme
MVICIFGNTVVQPGMEEAEAKLADKLAAILRKMPGFISSKSYVARRRRGDRADTLRLAGIA